MTALLDFQRRFAAALLMDASDAAAACSVEADVDNEIGLTVHINNTRASLRRALEATFPVTCRLVGDAFFAVMADRFVAAHPPRRGWLSAFGAALPAFIAAFPPAATLPYLADVAALEWARHRAAQAPAAPVLDLTTLSAFAADALADRSLPLHPTAALIISAYPLLEIWNAHQPEVEDDWRINLNGGHTHLLVCRPQRPIEIHELTAGEHALLAALRDGHPLGASIRAAWKADAGFGPGISLPRLVSVGTFAAL